MECSDGVEQGALIKNDVWPFERWSSRKTAERRISELRPNYKKQLAMQRFPDES